MTGLSGGNSVVMVVGHTAEKLISVFLCRIAAATNMATNSIVSGHLNALSKRAMGATGKVGVRFPVFSMALSNAMMRAGSTVKLQRRLSATPFEMTQPRSAPILSLRNTSITRPTKVVRALERMVLADRRIAAAMACGWLS